MARVWQTMDVRKQAIAYPLVCPLLFMILEDE